MLPSTAPSANGPKHDHARRTPASARRLRAEGDLLDLVRGGEGGDFTLRIETMRGRLTVELVDWFGGVRRQRLGRGASFAEAYRARAGRRRRLRMTDAPAAAPIDSLEIKLDMLRLELMKHLSCLFILTQIAATHLDLGLEDQLVGSMNDVTERMRSAVAVLRLLQQTRADAALSTEAAVEFRAARDKRRR